MGAGGKAPCPTRIGLFLSSSCNISKVVETDSGLGWEPKTWCRNGITAVYWVQGWKVETERQAGQAPDTADTLSAVAALSRQSRALTTSLGPASWGTCYEWGSPDDLNKRPDLCGNRVQMLPTRGRQNRREVNTLTTLSPAVTLCACSVGSQTQVQTRASSEKREDPPQKTKPCSSICGS